MLRRRVQMSQQFSRMLLGLEALAVKNIHDTERAVWNRWLEYVQKRHCLKKLGVLNAKIHEIRVKRCEVVARGLLSCHLAF